MVETGDAIRFSAFLSYSHHDERAARRLQRRLEAYRLPRRLRRGGGPFRQNGKLKPVFRDRDELASASDLTASVQEALTASAALIVVATPHAARSDWVGREIAFFRALPGERPILSALCGGDERTAFPAELAGSGDRAVAQPLAADFRRGGDGRLALLKLVAALAGVPLDALVQRDAQRRLRQVLVAITAGITVAIVVALLLTLAIVARQRAAGEQARAQAIVTQLVSQRDAISRAGRLDLLRANDQAALSYFAGRDTHRLPPATQLLAAKLLQGISEDDDTAGDVAGQTRAAAAAWAITDPLLRAAPQDPVRAMAHAQSEFWSAYAAWRAARLHEADRHFVAYAALAARLAAQAPADAKTQREAGEADSNLATFALQAGNDSTRAGTLFQSAQQHFLRAAALKPGDSDTQADIADGYGWLADIDRLGGNMAGALAYRVTQRNTLLAMQLADPGNGEIASALIKNQLGLGRVQALQGNWAAAIATLEAGRTAALEAWRQDRTNADMARQVRAFDLFEVKTWLDGPAALRPPLPRIAERLGDCARERAKPNNEEAGDFCTILEARVLGTEGSTQAGFGLLPGLKVSRLRQHLTERWRLNMSQEVDHALAELR